jgi:hypothetical protein
MSRLRRNVKVSNSRMSVREAIRIMNEASSMNLQSILRGRLSGVTGVNPDPRKDIDKECGYNRTATVRDFKEMYEEFGLAARIVNLLSDECFAVTPDVFETERPRDTPFEKGYKQLLSHPDFNLNYFFHKVDAISGIGRYAGLLIGVDDRKPLDTIADGLDEDGRMTKTRPQGRELIHLHALAETSLRDIIENDDPTSRRFRKPQFYHMDVKVGNRVVQRKVHWSRVLHVAECKDESEIYADPRLKKVSDQVHDCRKILGGSGEMFWKGGFPGIAATVDPRFIEAGGIDVDQESVTLELQRFMEGLQRYILGVGFQVNSLSPQVADPTAHLMMQFNMIAMAIGIPLRIFMGSEEAKLASGQDIKAWNKRIKRRQNDYVSPRIIRPMTFRLIAMGVIPPTKAFDAHGFPVFNIHWPDVAMPDENERSTIADRRAAAMLKFVTGKTYQMMQPSDFFRLILGLDPLEVEAVMKNLKTGPEIKFMEDEIAKAESEANIAATKDQAAASKIAAGLKAKNQKKKKGPADSGVKGSPPSDRRVDAIR